MTLSPPKITFLTFSKFLFFALLTISVPAFSASLSVAHLEERTDMPIIAIDSIAQDYRGFIWVGGSNGLARYDGHTFKAYREVLGDSASLSGNIIRGILEDKQNNLWVTTTEGLNLYNRDDDSFTRFYLSNSTVKNNSEKSLTTMMYDRQGKIWIGSSFGVNIFDTEKRIFIDADYINEHVGSANVFSIYEDRSGYVWLGTKFNGLYQVNKNTKTINKFVHNEQDNNSLSNNSIKYIVENRRNELWVATGYGLNRLDAARKNFTHFFANSDDPNAISENMAWTLFVDKSDDLWIGTDGLGLDVYNSDANVFSHNKHYKYQPNSLATNKVRDVFEDNHGGMWVATVPSGLDYTNVTRRAFDVLQFQPFSGNSIVSDLILIIHEDKLHNIWFGTEEGLSQYNPVSGQYTNYTYSESQRKGLSASAVLALESDDDGNIWIGTWSGGLNKLNPKTGEITVYLPSKEAGSSSHTVSSEFIWGLSMDKHGYLWIGTETGSVDRLNIKTGVFEHFSGEVGKPGNLSSYFIQDVLADSKGRVWVATNAGLNRLNPKTGIYKNYFSDESNSRSLLQNQVHDVFEGIDGDIWVSTDDGLSLYNEIGDDFESFVADHDALGEVIKGVAEDSDHNLWLATINGINRFNPKSKKFKNFTVSDGIASNSSGRPAIHYSSFYNKVFVGSTHGVTVIDPDSIIDNDFIPPVVFTELKINNEIIRKGNGILNKSITEASGIYLDYSHKMLSIRFASLDFSRPMKNKFKYKMEGFDKAWIESGMNNNASYTNLPSGSYEFLVFGSNGDGIWGEVPATLRVFVAPPVWGSYWAYCLYALVFGLLAYFFYGMQKNKLKFEKDKVAHFKYIDKLKDKILANTSHELRTPLNGIIGLADSLAAEADDRHDAASSEKLKTIAFSGRRLSSLINDILDFSKLKEHSLITSIKPVDVKKLVHQTLELTSPLLRSKHVELENLVTNNVLVYADEARLQQILLNLVGNAVKFTDAGSISVGCNFESGMIRITIKDTGIGIAKENLPTIFSSFQQLEGHQTRKHGGSGLGLAITQKLVSLLGGQIQVNSEIGEGSEFSFTLPAAEGLSYLESQNETAAQAEPPQSLVSTNSGKFNTSIVVNKTNQYEKIYDLILYGSLRKEKYFSGFFNVNNNAIYTILIVDDDPVNRMVVSTLLKKWNFSVKEAGDGYEALDILANNASIDLIVLDVMMPKMSGIEVCEKLRLKHKREDLPIIFLTANYNETEFTSGFLSGGNGFLLKPIAQNVLKESVSLNLSLLDEYRRDNGLIGKLSAEQSSSLSEIEYNTLAQAYCSMVNILRSMFDNLFNLSLWVWDADKNIYVSIDNLSTLQSMGNYFTPSSKFTGFIDGLPSNETSLVPRKSHNKLLELNLEESNDIYVNPLNGINAGKALLVYTTNTNSHVVLSRMLKGSSQLGLILLTALRKIKLLGLKVGW